MQFRLFSVPEFALCRPLGDYPPGATGASAPLESPDPPTSRTKRGVPVGGIGSGSFMFNLCGSFGPWHMDVGGDDSPGSQWGSERFSGNEERFLTGAGFHVMAGDGPAVALTTEDAPESWETLSKGEGLWAACFPKAWFCFDLSRFAPNLLLELAQTCPYVPRNNMLSSLPLGIFRLRAANHGTEPLPLRLALSFPQAPFSTSSAYSYPRKGTSAVWESSLRTAVLSLRAEHPDNPPETDRTEWVIAVAAPEGFEAFAITGLPLDEPLAGVLGAVRPEARGLGAQSPCEGGLVGASGTLEPGCTSDVVFVIAFDFPLVQFSNPRTGTIWQKRYKEYFPGHWRGADIARLGLERAEEIELGSCKWWEEWIDRPSVPGIVKMAAANELYFDVFGGSFWESGCLSKPKKFGRGPGSHLFFTLECLAYRDCETLDVHFYQARHFNHLFPDIERDLLAAWAEMIMDDPDRFTPHDAGSPVLDPWFSYGQYFATAPGLAPIRMCWKDLPSQFVQLCFCTWRDTGDDGFLARVLPACTATLERLDREDHDGDGVPDALGFDTSYDGLPLRGLCVYVGTLYAGARLMLAEMLQEGGSRQLAAASRQAAERAIRRIEEALWREEEGYYAACDRGEVAESLMADAFCGALYPMIYLGTTVLNAQRMRRHLSNVYRLNFLRFARGSRGTRNLHPLGSSLQFPMGEGAWVGGSYFVAATMIRLGAVLGDDELIRWGREIAESVARTTYLDEACAFWFHTPAIWFEGDPPRYRATQNMRPRAVWEVVRALAETGDRGRHPCS